MFYLRSKTRNSPKSRNWTAIGVCGIRLKKSLLKPKALESRYTVAMSEYTLLVE
jgi:hypothetical protein